MKTSEKPKPNVIPTIVIRSPEQLGNALRRIRKLQNLSQVELAKKAGLTQKTISKIESGNKKVEIGTLILILAALNIDLNVTQRPKGGTQNSLEGLF